VTKTWRSFIVVAITAATVTSAAGCTSSASNAAGGQNLSSSAAQSLTVWTFKKEWVPGLQAAAAAYASKTGKKFTLDVQYFDEANGVYSSKVSASARSNQLPDLLTAYGSQWDYVGGGLFKNLTGKMDEQLKNIPDSLVNDFVKYTQTTADACSANKDCTYKSVTLGNYYTVPEISGATGYFYVSKDQLTKAGLDATHIPANWAELIGELQATSSKLGQTGGLVMPLKIPETGWLWMLRPMLFTQLGAARTAALFSDKTGNLWKDPAVVNTLRLYDQLSPSWVPSVLQDDIEQGDDVFSSGKGTWYFGGTFSLAGLVQKGMDPNKLLIFPMPVAAGGALPKLQLQPWASGSIGISKNTKNEAATLAFLKFYMSQPAAQAFATAVHDTPAVTIPAANGDTNPLLPATKASFGQGADAYNEFTVYGPGCDGAKTLNNQAATALTALIGKHSTPVQVADKLQGLFQKAWAACG